jgi:hypothetical protein
MEKGQILPLQTRYAGGLASFSCFGWTMTLVGMKPYRPSTLVYDHQQALKQDDCHERVFQFFVSSHLLSVGAQLLVRPTSKLQLSQHRMTLLTSVPEEASQRAGSREDLHVMCCKNI